MGITMRLLPNAIFSPNLSGAASMPKTGFHFFCLGVLVLFSLRTESVWSQGNAAKMATKHANASALPAKEALIEVSHRSTTDGDVIVTVHAHKRMAAEDLKVELAFQGGDGPIAIPLEPERPALDSARIAAVKFKTIVHGLPQIKPNDPTQPFFAIHLAERGGARYYQEKSYAQFISAADKPFPVQPVIELPTQSLWARVRKPANRAKSTVAASALKLTATRPNSEVCALEWNTPANATAAAPMLALVFRNNEHIAITFTPRYVDRVKGLPANIKYRVEQIGKDGVVLSSNPVALPMEHVNNAQTDTNALYAAAPARTPEALAAVVSKHNPAIQYCYQREVKRNSALRGEIRVRIVINAGGSVDSVKVLSSTLQNPAVEDCVVGRIKRWNDFGAGDPARGGVAIKQTYVFGY